MPQMKIRMNTPLVEMDGDEMTRIMWGQIKDILIRPYVDLKTEYYDLGLENRDRTEDVVTIEAARATKRLGVAVKCATITPNMQRMQEYRLKKMWKSPNATIRGFLDGTVFRVPILAKGIRSFVPGWTKPVTVARHAWGDIYDAVDMAINEPGEVKLVYRKKDGTEKVLTVANFERGGVVLGMHNDDISISNFARTCMNFALEIRQDLYFAAKDTILKIYDQRFRDIFQTIFEKEFEERFTGQRIRYYYTLIDDVVARIIRSEGGFVWACKNYDGDVMSDLVASASGSLAMMTSVLVTPEGQYEYEAAHGTVTRHYQRYLKGEKTSTNPVATIFAWAAAMGKRGEFDSIPELKYFCNNLKEATLQVIAEGIMTGDLFSISDVPNKKKVDTESFLKAIADHMK
jgi:isocitrate dehydrogenase